MTAPHKRSRRAIALPLGMATATALAFLPNVSASAADTDGSATRTATTTADATALSYVVNVRPGHGTSASVKRAIAQAGGTIVTSYDQIGVIVVHSSNADFARTIRGVRGVQSAGNTRNAPLPAQSTTDMGAPQVLTAAQEKAASAEAAAGPDPQESVPWDRPAHQA
ncbi:peptidase S8, partial [Streptomyces sp. NPDC127044]